MAEDKPQRKSMNVPMPVEMRAKATALATVRGERDEFGRGVGVVVRRALAAYIAEHEGELPPWWRDGVDG